MRVLGLSDLTSALLLFLLLPLFIIAILATLSINDLFLTGRALLVTHSVLVEAHVFYQGGLLARIRRRARKVVSERMAPTSLGQLLLTHQQVVHELLGIGDIDEVVVDRHTVAAAATAPVAAQELLLGNLDTAGSSLHCLLSASLLDVLQARQMQVLGVAVGEAWTIASRGNYILPVLRDIITENFEGIR